MNYKDYKVGNLIGVRTMDGLSLAKITGVYAPADNDIRISYTIIRKPNFDKPLSKEIRGLLLPMQRYDIYTLEEYIESQENEINKRQGILNKIKEKREHDN